VSRGRAHGRLRSLAAAFGTADLRRIQAGWALSSIGNWGFMVALSIYAFDQGGAPAVGLAAALRLLPAAVMAPVAASLADRHPRRDVLVRCSVARAACLAGTALVVAAEGPFALALVLAAGFSVAATAHRPAQASLLATLARTPQQLAAANAVLSAIDNAGFLLGALVGATLAAAWGADVAFAVMAAMYAAAAVAQRRVRRDPRPAPAAGPGAGRRAGGAVAGLRALLASPQLRLVVGAFGAATVVEGATDVLVVLIALDLLDLGRGGVGYLNAAWGVGGLAGSAVAAAALGRGRLALALCAGCVLMGACLAALGAWPEALLVFALIAVLGVGLAVAETAEITLLQRLIPDDVLGRAFGVVEGVSVAATGVGALLAPVLVAALGIRGALIALGATLTALAIALWPRLSRFEAAAPVGEQEFRLLREVPFLAPLALATVESLAQRAACVPMGVGETVIRQGDVGDRFYVIADGEVEVSTDGRRRRRSSAGDFFGEIALLRDVPRTATVVATAPGTLLVVERGDFLAAVTGLPRSTEAAGAVVRGRLEAGG
jgi:MFS family permease